MPNFEAIYPFSQPLPMSNFKCCPCSRKEPTLGDWRFAIAVPLGLEAKPPSLKTMKSPRKR